MSALDEIVTVNITQNTAAVSQAGFGVPLILGTTGFTGSDLIRFYTDIDGVAADFATTDLEYKAAAAMFAQDVAPARIAIGERAANQAKIVTYVLSADLVASNIATVTVNGVVKTHTFATDHATSLAALAAKIALVDGVASAVAAVRTITITATAGRELTVADGGVTLGASQAAVVITTTQASKTVGSELDLLVLSADDADDWYCLILTSRLEADIYTAAAWIEARKKIFLACSTDAVTLTSAVTDIAGVLHALSYARTSILYHDTSAQYAEAAWAGRVLPLDPGSETWAFKSMNGISAVALTTTQSGYVRTTKKANTYEAIAGVNVTREGAMASGRFIDQTRFIDWMEARMKEGVFALAISVPKIPFTNAGISLVENVVRRVLNDGVAAGGIDPDSIVVSTPLVSAVSTANRAARRLPGVTFSARLTGAIHGVTVNGTVAV